VTGPLRALYASRLRRHVLAGPLPGHVALIMDGNRRWARQAGADPRAGHRAGVLHIEDVLSWCAALGIKHVTIYLCSTGNLRRRGDAEVANFMRLIEEVLAPRLARSETGWRVHVAGLLDLLPASTANAVKDTVAATRTCGTGAHLTLAVGYGGRQEVVDALREHLTEQAEAGRTLAQIAETLVMDDIARHLYTAGQPDPDLVIRTSGEQRMSDFLLWQSAYSELYFCDVYWPAFREIDFLRAIRGYAAATVARWRTS
jgi:short-chain Z-isoprenyl diphosphate synthase